MPSTLNHSSVSQYFDKTSASDGFEVLSISPIYAPFSCSFIVSYRKVTLELLPSTFPKLPATSIWNTNGSDEGDVFPAVSVAVTVIVFDPAEKAVDGVKAHCPEPSAVVVPIRLPLSKTLITAPASEEPWIVGVVSVVAP